MTAAPLCTDCKHFERVANAGFSGEPKVFEFCLLERTSTANARQQWYGVNSFPIDAAGHCGPTATLFQEKTP